MIKMNGVDLTQFQFDYDLTFALLFMNADGTIYGRYGSRSSLKDATKDISMAGLAESMAAALTLHTRYPKNKAFLAGKQPVATKFRTPNDYPSLRGKYKSALDYQAAVTKSCMHCHQVLDAERDTYRSAGKPIPDRLVFPYPAPEVVGISLDPIHRATIAAVADESPAKIGGFQIGDELVTLDGQAILSIADVQWVLHNTGRTAKLDATVRRDGKSIARTLELDQGWRRASDLSWRVTTWPLRRMGTGGLSLEEATESQRRRAGVGEQDLALTVQRVGQYGAHATAKRAGFRKGDILVAYAGQTNRMTPSQLLAWSAQHTQPGQMISVTLFRGSKKIEQKLPMQR